MFLSIIIPTLNEEEYLFQLLESIKKQDFSDYEIIVSDAGSSDKTIEIAKRFNCKIVPGGLPAKGRNEGAKTASGSLLFFLDADTILIGGFLRRNLEEIKKRNLDVAAVLLSSLEKKKLNNFFINILYNFPITLMEKILPHTAIAIFIKRDIFEKVKGFDENIILAEDHDMGRRASKLGRYGILRSAKVLASSRRFEKDGLIKTYIKYIYTELHMIFIGPVKKGGVIKYEFDHYTNKEKK